MNKDWFEKMADAEDKCGSISVGGWLFNDDFQKKISDVVLEGVQLHLFRLLYIHSQKLFENGINLTEDEFLAMTEEEQIELIKKINEILGIKELKFNKDKVKKTDDLKEDDITFLGRLR